MKQRIDHKSQSTSNKLVDNFYRFEFEMLLKFVIGVNPSYKTNIFQHNLIQSNPCPT